jgi:hypothetical protein
MLLLDEKSKLKACHLNPLGQYKAPIHTWQAAILINYSQKAIENGRKSSLSG